MMPKVTQRSWQMPLEHFRDLLDWLQATIDQPRRNSSPIAWISPERSGRGFSLISGVRLRMDLAQTMSATVPIPLRIIHSATSAIARDLGNGLLRPRRG